MFRKKKSKDNPSHRPGFTPMTAVLGLLLLIYSLLLLYMLVWAFLASVKDPVFEYTGNKLGFPQEWHFEHYLDAFRMFSLDVPSHGGNGTINVGLLQMFLNSLLYSVGCAFVGTLCPCIMGYLCARFPFKFNKVIYFIVIITMIITPVGNLPSEIRVAQALGLYNQIWGMWVMKANFLGMYFLVFYGIFKGVPFAYTEAAKIDGAGNFCIFRKIMLPLVRSTFLTVFLINFIGFWNDYQVPLIYLPSYPTVSYGVFTMTTTTINNMASIPMRMTAALLMLLPVLVIFLSSQKKLLGNLTVGGIKG